MLLMNNKFTIDDINPDHDLTPEEILSADQQFLLNLELESLSIEMGWGSYQEGDFNITLDNK